MRTDDERGGWRPPGCQAGPSPQSRPRWRRSTRPWPPWRRSRSPRCPTATSCGCSTASRPAPGRVTSTLGTGGGRGRPAPARRPGRRTQHRDLVGPPQPVDPRRGGPGARRWRATSRTTSTSRWPTRCATAGCVTDQAGVIVHAVERAPGRPRPRRTHPCPRPPPGGRRPPRRPAAPAARATDPRRRRPRGRRVTRAAVARGRGAAGRCTGALHDGRRRSRAVPRQVHPAQPARPSPPRTPPRPGLSPAVARPRAFPRRADRSSHPRATGRGARWTTSSATRPTGSPATAATPPR